MVTGMNTAVLLQKWGKICTKIQHLKLGQLLASNQKWEWPTTTHHTNHVWQVKCNWRQQSVCFCPLWTPFPCRVSFLPVHCTCVACSTWEYRPTRNNSRAAAWWEAWLPCHSWLSHRLVKCNGWYFYMLPAMLILSMDWFLCDLMSRPTFSRLSNAGFF